MKRTRFALPPVLVCAACIFGFVSVLLYSRRVARTGDPPVPTGAEVPQLELVEFLCPLGWEPPARGHDRLPARYFARYPGLEHPEMYLLITTTPPGARITLLFPDNRWYAGLSPLMFHSPLQPFSIEADLAGHRRGSLDVPATDLHDSSVELRIRLERDQASINDLLARARGGPSRNVDSGDISYTYDEQRRVFAVTTGAGEPIHVIGKVAQQPKVCGRSFALASHYELAGESVAMALFGYARIRTATITVVRTACRRQETIELHPLGRFGVAQCGGNVEVYDLVESRLLWCFEAAGDWTPYRAGDFLAIVQGDRVLLFDVFSGTRI